VSPLLLLGVMGSLNSGARVGLLVSGQIVTDSVSLNLSSCRITTGRGLPPRSAPPATLHTSPRLTSRPNPQRIR
jgi:hypothetical protein